MVVVQWVVLMDSNLIKYVVGILDLEKMFIFVVEVVKVKLG